MGCYSSQTDIRNTKSKEDIIHILERYKMLFEAQKKKDEMELQNKLTEYETLISDTELLLKELSCREFVVIDKLKEEINELYEIADKKRTKEDYVRNKMALFQYVKTKKLKESINNT